MSKVAAWVSSCHATSPEPAWPRLGNFQPSRRNVCTVIVIKCCRLAPERGKEHAQALLNLLVGIQDDAIFLVINKTDRQRHFQFAALSLVEDTAHQACLKNVQLSFAHRPFETEQKPIIVVTGIIEAVFVQDQRVSQSADFKQPMPVMRSCAPDGRLPTPSRCPLCPGPHRPPNVGTPRDQWRRLPTGLGRDR